MLLHHILHRLNFDAFVAAAGFQSKEEAISSRGVGAFVRASTLLVIEDENKKKR
jgi:hypothetical protein